MHFLQYILVGGARAELSDMIINLTATGFFLNAYAFGIEAIEIGSQNDVTTSSKTSCSNLRAVFKGCQYFKLKWAVFLVHIISCR